MKPIFAILFVFPCCLASCAKQKSCCPHEFEYSLCSSQTHPKCYCDRACFVRGDCCSDYKQYCLRSESEPCLYDQWTSWSSCSTSKSCDIGFKTRTRNVQQFGNFNSIDHCSLSALTESKICGDVHCVDIQMRRIRNRQQYAADNFHYSTALYEYNGGKCTKFEPKWSFACIMCADSSRCGNDVFAVGDTLDVYYQDDKCRGTWEKKTESLYRTQCFNQVDVNIYAFSIVTNQDR
jgi:hypothetical protein